MQSEIRDGNADKWARICLFINTDTDSLIFQKPAFSFRQKFEAVTSKFTPPKLPRQTPRDSLRSATREMSTPTEITRFAWEPLTPRGVAAFARASLGRLWLVQFIFALWLAVAVSYFVSHAWFPVIESAIRAMPEQGEVRAGKLNWRGKSPEFLADNRFLAFIVDLSHSGEIRSPAHVQIEFGATNVLAFSLFGRAETAYPKSWIVGFNRAEM